VIGLLLSLVLAQDGAMKVLAKRGRPLVGLNITIAKGLLKNGASENETRTQVEAALRRCRMSAWAGEPGHVFNASLLVFASGTDSVDPLGYAGGVVVTFRTTSSVEGFEGVKLDLFTDSRNFTGPPGSAGVQLRDSLAPVLDDLCNQYLRAREEVMPDKPAKASPH